MLVVIDANELFSLLIRGSKDAWEILVSEKVQLIAPEFLLIEFSNNKAEILSKTHRSEDEFLGILSIIESRIKFISEEEFKEFILKASRLFPLHSKDTPYLALALKYNCFLWSEEKLLKRQSEIKIFNTQELISFLNSE